MYSRGFSCILEGDMQKIIANFQQQFGLSANLKDFCKLARTSDVSTFHLYECGHSMYALSFLLQSKISDNNSFLSRPIYVKGFSLPWTKRGTIWFP